MNAAVILAAGESRRMGFPKALLTYHGHTFLDTLITLFTPRCSPVVAVLGAHADRIRAATKVPATFALNPDYALGMTTSLQCALRTLPPTTTGVLFTLVDHPAVAAATIDALLEPGSALLRVPRYQGHRGHPIWFSAALIPEFLALPTTGAAREVVRAHADQTDFLDLDDPGLIADIDDAEAYRQLTGATV